MLSFLTQTSVSFQLCTSFKLCTLFGFLQLHAKHCSTMFNQLALNGICLHRNVVFDFGGSQWQICFELECRISWIVLYLICFSNANGAPARSHSVVAEDFMNKAHVGETFAQHATSPLPLNHTAAGENYSTDDCAAATTSDFSVQ